MSFFEICVLPSETQRLPADGKPLFRRPQPAGSGEINRD
ncbi:hypothetical protein AGRO_1843 [Agrobacterium sp. ATCC 31749]|nr:hypothetical protein AGRO_1843 [Agrobacterium sp. ATCC 31749]